MSKIFSGQLYLIDDNSDRVDAFKNNLHNLKCSVFFNHFASVQEAFDMVLTPGIIAPEFIYIHCTLATFEAKDILKQVRKIHKSKCTKIIVFGNTISDGMVAASLKYNFRIIKTNPEMEVCSLFNADKIGYNDKVICNTVYKCC